MAGTGNPPDSAAESFPQGEGLEILDVLPGPHCTEITALIGEKAFVLSLDTQRVAQGLGMAVPDWLQVMMDPPVEWPNEVKALVASAVQQIYRHFYPYGP